MMLDDYCKGQPVAYNILNNAIANKTLTHAYLFSSDEIAEAYNFAFAFAKTLICPISNTNNRNCHECNICHRLDNNNFPELKVIKPDGLWIKKDQLMELQEEFRFKSLEGNKKIYIIYEADKLNVQAANSILKFLEEPEPGIIALLVTSDIHGVLPTILSRCQNITLKSNQCQFENINFDGSTNKTLIKVGILDNKKGLKLQEFINDAKNVVKLEAVVLFVKKYEALKLDVLLEIKKLLGDYFVEKEDYIWALDMMTLMYKDVINYMYNRHLEVFDYYQETIEFVATQNSIDSIIYKLQKILSIKEKIKYNINLNLLMDKLILEMESEGCL